jgi:hypothetical protein
MANSGIMDIACYPHGFIGRKNTTLLSNNIGVSIYNQRSKNTKTISLDGDDDILKMFRIDKSKTGNGLPVTDLINSYMKEYRKNSHIIHDFDFTQKIYILAKELLFPLRNFLKLQLLAVNQDNNGFNITNYDFLESTVNYFLKGEIGLSFHVWLPLLTGNNISNNKSKHETSLISDKIQHLIQLVSYENVNKSELKTNELKRFINQPNGISSLLYTLYILFGSEEGVKNHE